MAWSFRFAKIAGIDIRIHATFVFILALGAWLWGSVHGTPGALFGMLMMVLLFFCITLHELGHAFAARAVGIATREILLTPLGGLAMLVRNPSRPIHELFISAAGPLVNVAIAFALAFVGVWSGALQGTTVEELTVGVGPLTLPAALLWLIQANIALAIFNLIPAFPLDGGRILRALVGFVFAPATATRVATYTGQLLAVAIGAYALMTFNVLLIVIALMIYFGAGQERVEERTQSALSRVRVGDAYNQHALTLSVGDRVSTAANYILTSYQSDFAVLQGQTLIGIVTREDVLKALAEERSETYITLIMQRNVVTVDVELTLEQVRGVMAERSVRVVAVSEQGMFRGLVSIEDMSEASAFIEVIHRTRTTAPSQSPS